MNSWGYHLVADFSACDKNKITDKENVIAFAKNLVQAIEMVAYGEPQVVHFGTGNKAGFTLVQLIETSNICAHFCNDTGDVYLDVFSCKKFDEHLAIRVFKEHFSHSSVVFEILHRQATKL